MKNLFLTTTLFILGYTALAQPIVEPQYFPVTNTRVQQVWDDSCTIFTVPTQGANQVWDYSNVWLDIIDTTDMITYHPDSTPFASNFPTANQSVWIGNIPGVSSFDSLYNYALFDTSGLWGVGYYSMMADLPGALPAIKPELQMFSPVHYLDYAVDTGLFEGYTMYQGSIPAYVKRDIHKTLECTGWGTLMTPDATWDNVLLIEEIVDIYDSIFIDPLSTGTYTFAQTYHYTPKRYHFLRNNTFGATHLMQLNGNHTGTNIGLAWYALPADFGSIAGTVLDSTGLPVTSGEMLLYREHSNFARNDILATTTLDVNGNFQFDSIPHGIYRIAVRADSLLYPNSLTTYHGDTTDWMSCQEIITDDSLYSGMVINLQYHSPLTGQGNLQGTVYLDLSFTRNNDPIPGIDVVVRRNPSGVSTVGNITDGGGGYGSGSLAPGNYTIFVDVPGLHMAGTYDVTITGANSVLDLDFIIGLDSIYPVFVTGIEELSRDQGISAVAFPNPSNDEQTVAFSIEHTAQVEIRLLDLQGKVVDEAFAGTLHKGSYSHTFTGEDFPSAGIYLVEVSVGDHKRVLKLLRE